MIDRGDLAAEIGLEDLYEAVEHIVSETKSSGKPLIMATENLESMLDREVPSKSEVISLHTHEQLVRIALCSVKKLPPQRMGCTR